MGAYGFAARSACSDPVYSRRGMARLDEAGTDDLGVFPLRHLVQSRPVGGGLCIFAARLTDRTVRAEYRGLHSAGDRFGRLHLLRAACADGSNDAALAFGRTELAFCRRAAVGTLGVQLP